MCARKGGGVGSLVRTAQGLFRWMQSGSDASQTGLDDVGFRV